MQQCQPGIMPLLILQRDYIWPSIYHETQRLDCAWPMTQDFHSLHQLTLVYLGQSLLRQQADVEHADADFLRMACTPRLVLGAGSFALFAGLAGGAGQEVRAPSCVVSAASRKALLIWPRLQR